MPYSVPKPLLCSVFVRAICIIRTPRMKWGSVRSCSCLTFPRRLHMSCQTLPTKLLPVLLLWNIITTEVDSTYYMTWCTQEDFLWLVIWTREMLCSIPIINTINDILLYAKIVESCVYLAYHIWTDKPNWYKTAFFFFFSLQWIVVHMSCAFQVQ